MTNLTTHQIRLAGPWEYQSTGGHWERCMLPFQAPPHSPDNTEPSNKCRLRRKFHRPTGLSADTTLMIELSASRTVLTIQVNGTAIDRQDFVAEACTGSEVISRFSVTEVVQSFNELEILISDDVPTTIHAARILICEPHEKTSCE